MEVLLNWKIQLKGKYSTQNKKKRLYEPHILPKKWTKSRHQTSHEVLRTFCIDFGWIKNDLWMAKKLWMAFTGKVYFKNTWNMQNIVKNLCWCYIFHLTFLWQWQIKFYMHSLYYHRNTKDDVKTVLVKEAPVTNTNKTQDLTFICLRFLF